MAVATTGMPVNPPTALTAPRMAIEAVRLAALPMPMPPTTTVAAEVPTGLAKAGDVLQDIPNAIAQSIGKAVGQLLAGAGAGVIFGFVAAGVVAENVIYRIPVVGEALAPLITVIALAGAIVGAPIGAVVGLVVTAARWVSGAFSRPSGSAKRPASAVLQRTTQPGTRSNRHIAKSSAPVTSKVAAPQQHSDQNRSRAGSARHAVAKGVGGH